jgi:poly-gamma-glutamate capsule biosynthesis protein CapA/YwtB (metallophosphatase superfamily)
VDKQVKHFRAWLVIGFLFFAPLFGIFQTSQTARLPEKIDYSGYPWVYQRKGISEHDAAKMVELILVGDILCGRNGYSQGLSFDDSTAWLREADLTIGNLECVLSAARNSVNDQNLEIKPYLLYGSPLLAGDLRQAGFDILGLANNHALDLGEKGLVDTVKYLGENGVSITGIHRSGVCGAPVVIKQLDPYRIAVIAFNAVPVNREELETSLPSDFTVANWGEQDCILAEIQAASQETDAVVVLAHWGIEYEDRENQTQEMIANRLIQSGADLVVGQHPHVPQPIKIYPQIHAQRDSLVAYSLGNFLADQEFGETVHGLGLRVFVDDMGLCAVQLLPIQAGPKPRLLKEDPGSSWLTQVMPAPQQVAFDCEDDQCSENKTISILPRLDSGLFWSGEIDLTGDDVPEQIQRQAGRVIVYQDGKEAWRSPENWQVVDLALGDPDQDGRQEMMMAFWRPDKNGLLRSHPFIVGYRGGTYHETWGGSGVSDPILELELGDVDGDGLQELVVLEQRKSGKEAVTVWDWHGWGFSLKWRSSEGNYSNLKLVQNPTSEKDLIIVSQSPS